ncbi:thioredoxin family protein [Hyphomicrobium sp.]|uniref:thioredoxin family protein n=1 Tax=Hyphomicrobium sp. TaxID=82 RepID=UPI002CBEA8BD|nr:thioredoxin family protein [Hyphomicrobium sp.]HRN88270.1 thioredoxin family protein [Hyphomicrobium sp.]HRQ27866.1 thioredoxin family protein [Hyphomicrobium sp.]
MSIWLRTILGPQLHHTVAFAFTLIVWSALAQAPAAARSPNLSEAWNGAEIAWRDVGPGIREATRTGKPLVMVFHAEWCKACRRYREVWKDPGVVAGSRNFVMVLVDVDQRPQDNGAFSPDGTYIPRTIFYSAEGEVMKHVRGKDPEFPHTIDIEDPTELRTLMEQAAGGTMPAPAPELERRASN